MDHLGNFDGIDQEDMEHEVMYRKHKKDFSKLLQEVIQTQVAYDRIQ
jgi:hypothetical protein